MCRDDMKLASDVDVPDRFLLYIEFLWPLTVPSPARASLSRTILGTSGWLTKYSVMKLCKLDFLVDGGPPNMEGILSVRRCRDSGLSTSRVLTFSTQPTVVQKPW